MNSSSIFSYTDSLSESHKEHINNQIGGNNTYSSSSDFTSDDDYHIQFGGSNLKMFSKPKFLNKIAINKKELKLFETKLKNKKIKIKSRRELKQLFIKHKYKS